MLSMPSRDKAEPLTVSEVERFTFTSKRVITDGFDEVLLIQGTNVSDTYLICVDEQEWLIVELGALDHYYQY